MDLEFAPAVSPPSTRVAEPTPWLSAAGWLLALALVASYSLSALLPGTWGWENGVLENAQVLVLLAGLAVALSFGRGAARRPARRVAAGAALLWAIAAARELSWGAVLMQPLTLKSTGPVFSSSQLPYHDLVHPVLGLLVAVSVLLLALGRIDAAIGRQLRERRFPRFELALMVAGMLVSTLAEGHLHLSGGPHLPELQGQVLEELAELIAYAALFLTQLRFFRELRA